MHIMKLWIWILYFTVRWGGGGGCSMVVNADLRNWLSLNAVSDKIILSCQAHSCWPARAKQWSLRNFAGLVDTEMQLCSIRLLICIQSWYVNWQICIDSTSVRTFKYQYTETNVMHFIFSLLSINGLYMFRALLALPQEVLHKRHLVYCMVVISVGYSNDLYMFEHYLLILRRRYTSDTCYVVCVLCQLAAPMASICFEYYLLILRKCYTNGTWYIAYVLCQLAAPAGAANWHNMHAIYLVPLVQNNVTCQQNITFKQSTHNRWFEKCICLYMHPENREPRNLTLIGYMATPLGSMACLNLL
jgi:hypothetical protein